MASEPHEDKAEGSDAQRQPRSEDIAAALDEARQNARLLRVSSSLFLKEAKELIETNKVKKAPLLGVDPAHNPDKSILRLLKRSHGWIVMPEKQIRTSEAITPCTFRAFVDCGTSTAHASQCRCSALACRRLSWFGHQIAWTGPGTTKRRAWRGSSNLPARAEFPLCQWKAGSCWQSWSGYAHAPMQITSLHATACTD